MVNIGIKDAHSFLYGEELAKRSAVYSIVLDVMFGRSSVFYSKYYEKGIITELIAINTIEIGRKAVNELFEYVNTGFANSYVIADVEVLKGGR